MSRVNALFALLIASNGVDHVTAFTGGFLRGDPLDEENRIIGGQDATVNEFPFYCDIRSGNNRGHWCGGTLLPSGRHVLTAAHCLMGVGGSPDYTEGILEGEVWCNAHDVTKTPAADYVRTVTSIHFYDDSNTRSTEYPDVAILTLSSPITTVNQFLICNEDANIPGANDELTHIGMGTINRPNSNEQTYQEPDVLQEVTLFSTTCPYGATSSVQWVLCAHDNEPGVVRNGCRGDSGSALFDSSTGLFLGIDSFGSGECDHPTGFTRASAICPWACTYDAAFCTNTRSETNILDTSEKPTEAPTDSPSIAPSSNPAPTVQPFRERKQARPTWFRCRGIGLGNGGQGGESGRVSRGENCV